MHPVAGCGEEERAETAVFPVELLLFDQELTLLGGLPRGILYCVTVSPGHKRLLTKTALITAAFSFKIETYINMWSCNVNQPRK